MAGVLVTSWVIVTQLWELRSRALTQETGPLFLPVCTQGLSFPHDLLGGTDVES